MVLTTAHSDEDLERFVQAFHDALQEMQSAGFLPEEPVQQADQDIRSPEETADAHSKISEPLSVPQATGRTAPPSFFRTTTFN